MALAKLASGKTRPGDSGNTETLPAWAEPERCERAQRFFIANLTSMLFSLHLALVSGLSVPAFLDVLSRTSQSSTPPTSIRRYLMTMAYIVQWHEGDVTDPKSACRRAMHAVRTMHRRVVMTLGENHDSSELSKENIQNTSSNQGQTDTRYRGNPGGDRADEQPSPSSAKPPLVINQYDMALTQTGFFGVALLIPRACGLRFTREELEDYIHFWRVIGYLLGIEDAYNAAAGTYEETVALCREISDTVITPAATNPTPLYIKMADAYCRGYNDVVMNGLPIVSTRATLAYASLASGKNLFQDLSLIDWLRVYITRFFIFMLYWCPGFASFSDSLLYRFYKEIQQKYHFAYNKSKQ